MQRWSRLALTVLAAAFLAACGSDGSLTVLAAAPEQAREAGSARFDVDVEMSSESLPGGAMSMSGSGATEFPDRVHLAMTTSGVPGMSGDVEMTIDGTVMYMRMAFLEQILPEGKSWVRIDLETIGEEMGVDVAQLMQSGQGDPTAWLESLRGASGDIERLGTEEIRGVRTTHNRVTVDTEAAIDRMDEALAEDLETLFEQTGVPDTYPAEVWMGDDGLARRISFEIETDAQGVGPMRQSTTMEFYDYGAEVDIPVPPEDETVDFQRLVDEAGGGA